MKSETQTKTTQNVNELKAKQIKFNSFHDFVSVCSLLEKNISLKINWACFVSTV